MATVPSLEDYDVSPVTGFVPEKQPLERLPSHFDPWEEIAQNLPKLIAQRTLRVTVEKLPLLDHSRLSEPRELNRAHLVLCVISHAYVWCEGKTNVVKVLPRCLAVPWVAVSKILDLPPVLIHSSYILHNWRQVNLLRPLSMDNLKPLITWSDTRTEQGFIKVHLQVELAFGLGVKHIVDGQQAVLDDNVTGVCKALDSLCETMLAIQKSFLHVHDFCDPEEFFNDLRPYLAGWSNNQSFPEGLIYEGVSTTPLKYFGGSAAESAIFPVLDAALGVKHYEDPRPGTCGLVSSRYLDTITEYIPPTSRKFMKAVSEGPSMREYVQNKQDEDLVLAYDKCVKELKKFRSFHVRVAAKFVTMQANKNSKSKEEAKLAQLGTGGSAIMPFLKKIRDETSATILSVNNNPSNT